jgi:hypothetical protein
MYMREKTRIRLHQNEIPKERGNIIQRQKEREGEESKIISNQNGTHKTYYIYIYIYIRMYVCMYYIALVHDNSCISYRFSRFFAFCARREPFTKSSKHFLLNCGENDIARDNEKIFLL